MASCSSSRATLLSAEVETSIKAKLLRLLLPITASLLGVVVLAPLRGRFVLLLTALEDTGLLGTVSDGLARHRAVLEPAWSVLLSGQAAPHRHPFARCSPAQGCGGVKLEVRPGETTAIMVWLRIALVYDMLQSGQCSGM